MSAKSSPRSSLSSELRSGSGLPSSQASEATATAASAAPPPQPGISFRNHARSQSPRRRSIQFHVSDAETQLPSRSNSIKGKRLHYGGMPTRDLDAERESRHLPASRGPSPPPPKTYERGVSFNTFDNRDASDFSLTLNYKHKGYQSTRRSRTFLCGTDQNDYSDFALNWLVDELVDDGDEIVCLRAVEKDSRMASDAGIEEGNYRQEAERLFEQVIQKNSQNEKAISLVLELVVGKVEEIIQRMGGQKIRIYEPVMLIVGTRGRNLQGVHSLLPGSVSKYCVQHSPIPVIVVRPSLKREKKKKKRRADPGRRSYNHLLKLSERRGIRVFDPRPGTQNGTLKLPDEEAAVAEALGLPPSYSRNNSRSSLSVSDRSSLSTDDSEASPPVPYSLDSVVMSSPLGGSPASSEENVMHSRRRRDGPLRHGLNHDPAPPLRNKTRLETPRHKSKTTGQSTRSQARYPPTLRPSCHRSPWWSSPMRLAKSEKSPLIEYWLEYLLYSFLPPHPLPSSSQSELPK
ncbi:Universal stress protein A family protein [Penicillium oxalicum]|uniref:Universal stress protein A family protein n=1 Tax=Penicillium oxalicum TaxID=69781 RepID=UPI0020B7E9C4|nr:Universal stress protein A family protein [Penicillium oxalicum]KAI2787476.1 Universal stress protein A family protein [Penicillium oxalicum]